MNEECGVFGAFLRNDDVFFYIVEGLIALQHRGQESFGMAISDFDSIKTFKKMGMITSYDDISKFKLNGKIGIGHVRYSTKGKSNLKNAQPLKARFKGKDFAIAHNGQIENADSLKIELENTGVLFVTDSDTELILQVLVKNLLSSPSSWEFEEMGRVIFDKIMPSYSILISFKDRIIALRDERGYRPLFVCKNTDGYFLSSEDCAFKNLEKIEYIREVQPGEIVEINEFGIKSKVIKKTKRRSYCFFEQIYFSRPDSNIFGLNVHRTRERLGMQCAIENPVNADIVVPVMDSGFSSALGYSHQSGIPIEMGLMKNKYIGRTFINPKQRERERNVSRKLSAIRAVINEKKIVLVDDSIVRGTTMKAIVSLLKEAGAKEVHVRVGSPPVKDYCKWGVDIPERKKLIAYDRNPKEIAETIGANSVGYVSFDGIRKILGNEYESYCFHCFGREK